MENIKNGEDYRSFKGNITIRFTPEEDDKKQTSYNLPEGYRIIPESKSARLNLLLSPRLKKELKKVAKDKGTSVNNLINLILMGYIEGR